MACGRDDLFFFFFALHLILDGKLDICERDDFVFCSDFGQKIGASVGVMTFFLLFT